MPYNRPYQIGSRSSALAKCQTTLVLQNLQHYHPDNQRLKQAECLSICTTGDKITDRPLAEIGGKALFTKEIQQELLKGRLDFAVHSLKDLEHTLPPGLTIGAVLPREDCRDVLITHSGKKSLSALKVGASVGTCSPRRTAQLLYHRPDLKIVPLRGNVPTRLCKMFEEGLEAIVLAAAGLKRLGLWQEDNPSLHGYPLTGYLIPLDQMLPAVGQGVLAVECRSDDEEVKALLSFVNHPPTESCVRAERAFLRELNGDCHTAVAALSTILSPTELKLKICYAPDYPMSCKQLVIKQEIGLLDQPEALGLKLAKALK